MTTRVYFYVTKLVIGDDGVTFSRTIRSTIGKDPVQVEQGEYFDFWLRDLPPGCSGKVRESNTTLVDDRWNDITLMSLDEKHLERYINSF